MSSAEAPDDRQGIQSVENAMLVLLALERGFGPVTLSQIAAGSGMQPSKAHRYLVSLCRSGLVSQSPRSGLYDLGPALRRLGAEAIRRMDEVALASEHLDGFRDRTGHPIGLYVWGEGGPVLVRWDNGRDLWPITVRVGTTIPVATTSVGRVFLALLPATLTDPLVNAARDAGQHDLSAEDITRIKGDVRRDGLAVTTNALLPGVSGISAPVLTPAGSLPLALITGLPNAQATPAGISAIAVELLRTARAISAEIGSVLPG